MRLKVYTAKTVAAAMDRIRAELGDDAVIVTVDAAQRGGPVRVTAAIDRQPMREAPGRFESEPPPPPSRADAPFDATQLAAVLRYHSAPTPVATRLQTLAAGFADSSAPEALARGLEEMTPFAPLDLASSRPLLLAGLPGQGKTLAAARLATAARLAGRAVRIITLDAGAAGALEQLRAFCAPIEAELHVAEDARALERRCGVRFEGLTIIDTAGLNPYALADIELIAHGIKRSGAEPIWVMAAGIDALEAAEMADIFASLGARRLIATRLDAARRLGALLTAPIKARLALAGFCASPFLSDPIEPATPLALARLLLDKPDPGHIARALASAARPSPAPASQTARTKAAL